MPELYEYAYRVRRFYNFYPKELREMLISTFIIALIWAFDDGRDTFNLGYWLWNYFKTLIIVAIAFFVFISGNKLVALWHGYRIEYRMWPTGLSGGLIIALLGGLFGARIAILLPGKIYIQHMMKQRLGEFRYGLNSFEGGLSAMGGPIFLILFAMFAKTIEWIIFGSNAFLNELYWFSLVFTVYMMLPLPDFPGLWMYFGSRMTYVFFFGSILTYVLLASIFNFYSLIFAIIGGGIIWLLYNWFFEYGEKDG